MSVKLFLHSPIRYVHLARDDAETQAVTVDHPEWGAAWRQREVEAVSSPRFRKALEDNQIILIGWRDIKKSQSNTPQNTKTAHPGTWCSRLRVAARGLE